MSYERCPRPMLLQALIFSKKTFDVVEAAEWLVKNRFRPDRLTETGQSYRAQLYAPRGFDRQSFRTISLGRGTSAVRAVVGCPKLSTWKTETKKRTKAKATLRAKKRKASRR